MRSGGQVKKRTVYLTLSVTDLLSTGTTPEEVLEGLAEAVKTYTDATPSTIRKWQRRAAKRIAALEVTK